MENDSKYQMYAAELVQNVPSEYMDYLIGAFMEAACINMGVELNDKTLDRAIYHIKKDFRTIPVCYIYSAFVRGSLGVFGAGRLVPRTIHGWLNEITVEYNRASATEKLRNEPPTMAMDLNRYPAGQAIIKKMDWLTSGAITEAEWDRIPLKQVAERIRSGLSITPADFLNPQID